MSNLTHKANVENKLKSEKDMKNNIVTYKEIDDSVAKCRNGQQGYDSAENGTRSSTSDER